MISILRTDDPATLSFAVAVLDEAGVANQVLDRHTAFALGAVGAMRMRLVVEADNAAQARRLLSEAGLSRELMRDDEY